MAKSTPRTMHDLRVAAMGGDYGAAKKLLRLHKRHAHMAAEIRTGKPIPPRVRRMLDAQTAGTGTEWEAVLYHHLDEEE
jgi:hypothetical protein